MYDITNCFSHLPVYLGDYPILHNSTSAYRDVFLIYYKFSIETHNLIDLTNLLLKDISCVYCAIIQMAGHIVSFCVCIFEHMETYS